MEFGTMTEKSNIENGALFYEAIEYHFDEI
jgi:hypothetical protein